MQKEKNISDNIPIFGKIFEKFIYNRLNYSFFSAMNVIYDKQFGYRKIHSTTHAVNYSSFT